VSVRAAPAAEVYGRRAIPNPGDLWYLLADRTPEVFDLHPPPARLILRGEPYNRPDEPTDVACALLAALHASPQRIGPSRLPSVAWLDRAIRTLEGAVGPSVSIRSGCGVLKQLGVITGYAWTYDAGEIVRWLQTGQSGLVLGIDWYAAMSRPDRTGMIRAWGKAMGGRAIHAWGYDAKADAVLVQNNWGADWGGWSTRKGRHDFRGCARLPVEDLKRLLADNGEAVALFKDPGFTRFSEVAR